jgi:hypothetical protein
MTQLRQTFAKHEAMKGKLGFQSATDLPVERTRKTRLDQSLPISHPTPPSLKHMNRPGHIPNPLNMPMHGIRHSQIIRAGHTVDDFVSSFDDGD